MRHQLLAVVAAIAILTTACGSDPPADSRSVGEVIFDREPVIRVPAQFVAVDLDGDGVERVTIDSGESYDLDGIVVDYVYRRGLDVVATGQRYTDDFEVGETVVTVSITDDNGLTDHQAVVVRVLVPYQQSSDDSPEIEIWGPGLEIAMSPTINQRWFNVAGNVSDPDGIIKLTWSLNGSSDQQLSRGPDDRRLAAEGDFNIDIPRAALPLGKNTVEITAIDSRGERTTVLVRVDNEQADSPQFPIKIDWAENELEGIVEIVDGGWVIDQTAAELVMSADYAGYDRLLSIGDQEWRDFDVRATVTLDGVVDEISPHSGGSRGFGVLLRWNGHNDSVSPGSQPQAGFLPDRGQNLSPAGAFLIYSFQPTGDALLLSSERFQLVDESTEVMVIVGGTYHLRAQVQTVTNGSVYRAKIWAVGTPEPEEWAVSYVAAKGPEEPPTGSLILLSHETSTRWGSVFIDSVPEADRLSVSEVVALKDAQP